MKKLILTEISTESFPEKTYCKLCNTSNITTYNFKVTINFRGCGNFDYLNESEINHKIYKLIPEIDLEK